MRALHLHQAADRTFEFEAAVACCIKGFGVGLRRREQFDPVFVERVDQCDETAIPSRASAIMPLTLMRPVGATRY